MARPGIPRPQAMWEPGERIADFKRLFEFYVDIVENTDFGLAQDYKSHERMLRDGQVYSALRLRQIATCSRPVMLKPRNDSEQALRYCRVITKMFERLPMQRISLQMLGAIATGSSVQEITWQVNDNLEWYPEALNDVHHTRIAYNTRGQLLLKSTYDPFFGEKLPPYTFVVHRNETEGGAWDQALHEGRLLHGRGILDRVYPWHLWKQILLRFALKGTERASSGVLIIKFPKKDASSFAQAQNIAKYFTQSGVVLVPDEAGWSVELLRGDFSTSEGYTKIIEYIDEQIAKIIIGNTMLLQTTSGGSYASLETAEQSTLARLAAFDANNLLETLNNQLIAFIMAMNNWPLELAPIAAFKAGPRSSLTEILNAIIKLREIGYPVSVEMIEEETRIRQPREGEVVLRVDPYTAKVVSVVGPSGAEVQATLEKTSDVHATATGSTGGTAPAPVAPAASSPGTGPSSLPETGGLPGLVVLDAAKLTTSRKPVIAYGDTAPVETDDGTPIGTIVGAARRRHMVHLTYVSTDGKLGEYDIEPYSIRRKGQSAALYGFDVSAGRTKSFLVSGIQSAHEMTGMVFTPQFEVEFGHEAQERQ